MWYCVDIQNNSHHLFAHKMISYKISKTHQPTFQEYLPGFFLPDFIAEIRLCSQSQKVYFFPKMWQKIPNFQKKKIFFFLKEVSNAYYISFLIQLHLTKYYMILFF